ncbi:hypothetical protein OOK44_38100 [Streptomyces cellulosae]|uniref:hypothetical protein n=1 Tax=Streptomyces cellulosae TaxID=1968 RepID=UPI002250CF51|nr:hypothetical protein [Streptomyces cellulosae]MCX4482190.1 hypothetical protein [Streptomyces cellulosae]
MSRRVLAMPSTRSEEPEELEELEAGPQLEPAAARSAGVVAELTGADLSTPLTVEQVPAPYAPSEAEELTAQERADLETCERAVNGLQTSFALAGKALATINQARLYREEYATFVDYLEARWQMSESQAYRLMDGWQVAALLSAHGLTVLNERQGRELNAIFKAHGGPAMIAVAKTVTAEVKKPTAALLGTVRKALPRNLPDDPDQRERVVAEATRRALPIQTSPIGGETPAPGTSPNGGETEAGGGDVTPDQVDEGVEAIAVLEDAAAHQALIAEKVTGKVLTAALLYDPGRAELLRAKLREGAKKVAHRTRDPEGADET